MTECDYCGGHGVVQECEECDWRNPMCNYCDGTGYIDCPFIEESWHE